MSMKALLLSTWIAGLSLLSLVPPAIATPIRVAVASDMKFVMEELIQDFKANGNPDAVIEAVYGSSGTLSAQIIEGAPFDLFIPASQEYSDLVIQNHRQRPGLKPNPNVISAHVIARGGVSLWVKKGSDLAVLISNPIEQPKSLLLNEKTKRVSLANPKGAPYGKAAEAALRASGIYDQIKGKLVFAENAVQSLQLVQNGQADAAIIATALALSKIGKAEGVSTPFPDERFKPNQHSAVVLKSSAQGFSQYLGSSSAQRILSQYGFSN